MTGTDLLRALYARGAHIRPVNGRIEVRAPRGAVPETLFRALGEQRDEVLAALRTYPCTGCGKFAFSRPRLCYWCSNGRVEA